MVKQIAGMPNRIPLAGLRHPTSQTRKSEEKDKPKEWNESEPIGDLILISRCRYFVRIREYLRKNPECQ
jgi:hypothetical protein